VTKCKQNYDLQVAIQKGESLKNFFSDGAGIGNRLAIRGMRTLLFVNASREFSGVDTTTMLHLRDSSR
jgi:hypothetical protein